MATYIFYTILRKSKRDIEDHTHIDVGGSYQDISYNEISNLKRENINRIQEVFHVYLNKFEIAVSHLFLIIFSNNKFTLVN